MLMPKRNGSGGDVFSGWSHRRKSEPAGAGGMEWISRTLRQEREHRQISLQEVEQRTRIPLKYLQLLEGGGNAQVVPDPLYLISPLRGYAAFLNINLGTALTDFIAEVEELPPVEEKACGSWRPTHLLKYSPQLQSPLLLRTLSLLLILGILTFVGYYRELPQGPQPKEAKVIPLPPLSDPLPVPESETPPLAFSPALSASPPAADQAEPASPSPTVSAPVTAALQVQPSVTSAPRVEPPVVHAHPQPQKSPGSALHLLRIQAKAKTWLHVTIDSQPLKRLFLQPGQSVQWSAKRGFTLSVGNAGGVKLTLDGHELPPLGKAGQTILSVGLPSRRGSHGGQVRYAERPHATKPRSPRR